jgi:hypothetical protein
MPRVLAGAFGDDVLRRMFRNGDRLHHIFRGFSAASR